MATGPAPLDGITVVTMEHAVAAPFATRQLRDMGARVIKVERPDGGDFARGYDTFADGLASYFVWLNRGKESVALDVKQPAALAALRLLIDRADVFVQNLSPGAAGRLGLDAATLRSSNPRLVVCDISGYGPDGPFAEKRAYDMLVQAEAGLAAGTGTGHGAAKAGAAVADLSAGTYACSAVVTALYARERTGEGAAVSVAMLDAVAEWMTNSYLASRATGEPQQSLGLAHATLVPYDGFPTADGADVVVAVQNDREWARLAAAIGCDDPRFETNAGRMRHRAEVDGLVAAALARLSADDAIALLEGADIACARVRTSLDLLTHPQLDARNRWRDTPTSVGPIPVLLPPVTIAGHEVTFGAVPGLGEHTAQVLGELGMGEAEIAKLVG